MRLSVVRLLASILLSGCLVACGPAQRVDAPRLLGMPELGEADYRWIAARIFANEARGRTDYLAWWNEGEDFPSLGIGHFIWFPAGVDAPFDETFPRMVEYVSRRSRCAQPPAWLTALDLVDAPWSSKAEFDAVRSEPAVAELREWLAATAPEQAHFIVASFRERWNSLELPAAEKQRLTELLQRLLSTSRGLYAVIDYFNFKGIGSNPRERYAGEGWGLVQVLGDVAAGSGAAGADLVERFSRAAAGRLELRVENSPPERNEARWLEGWRKRVGEYTEAAPALAAAAPGAFRVRPYLRSLEPTGAGIAWLSESATPGRLAWHAADAPADSEQTLVSEPRLACELGYHLAEFADLPGGQGLPYLHRVALSGLEPGREYVYSVDQDGDIATGHLRAPGGPARATRFIVYGDSETEPESWTERVDWPEAGREDEPRQYLVDQGTGYTANLEVIAARQPDFVAIAGDLVESGGEQRDWDEFWKHNGQLAASVPLVPAAGNHDHYGGPGDLGGYGEIGVRRALGKFHAYFGDSTWYRFDYGPVAVVVIDANNGLPERSEADTNWRLDGADGIAPSWQAGSAQRDWLQQTLAAAQREAAFTFVMMHPTPYTSGVHGRPPGLDDGRNFASGLPLRDLTPVFLEYGVDAVFSGHDEQYEHSVVTGTELLANGSPIDHAVHFLTVGIGGDGLRGPERDVSNPQRVFLAHDDAPEQRDAAGVLVDGGKHYGHLEVDVVPDGQGGWRAEFEPVYVFPVTDASGRVERFERRVYADTLVLESRGDD